MQPLLLLARSCHSPRSTLRPLLHRPFRVKRFQAYPPLQFRCRSRARASLRIGAGPFHRRIRRRGRTIFRAAFVSVTTGPSGHANSPHPSSQEDVIPPLGRARFPSIGFDPARFSCCCRGLFPVQRNSVPSTHMPYIITANRRARATIAFFIPRRLAICIAQALTRTISSTAACSELLRRA